MLGADRLDGIHLLDGGVVAGESGGDCGEDVGSTLTEIRRSVQVCRCATRVCTSPNDGAVSVGNTAGC
jgi:hypothetical protein